MLATPESPPMNQSMVMREAQCIVHRLEALATTPLVDTRQVTLVDFTLSSSELNMTGSPCCKLFHEETPKKNDTLLENELILAEEQLGALSLSTSTPLQLSPSAPVFGASFTIGTADATGLEPCKDLSPCSLPCPAGTECKAASPKAFLHKALLSDQEDAPSSPCLVTLDEALELRGAGGGLVDVLAGSAPHQSPSLAAGETGLRASDRATDGPCHLFNVAGSDDGNLNSTPPEPLPALGESFIVTREFPTADTVALDGSPVPETTFAIPDSLPVETAVTQAPLAKMDATMIREDLLGQPSSESAALASRNVPCTPPESLPAHGVSFVVATESQAASTVALHGSPVAIGVAETTFAIPDISPVVTAEKQAPSAKMGAAMNRKAGGLLRQPSTKSAALASRSVPSPCPAPLQRPAARLSVATKPRAVPVRPSAGNRAVADTTFATSMRPPSRPPVASKACRAAKVTCDSISDSVKREVAE
ncbi:uncharacterized protein LOC119372239 [Rhipicephalus sanguineus]|uniref:uncharacterized protein LOC119372239 n=1 Tax=Rhipicephalus sanguineus TaxID=34632 RepID=UPI0020C33087|nr:uncharacterized protein LOC119372239 [Rhipicephalus sanguineus]